MPTSFTMLSPVSPGPLSSALTPVGGIVIDLLGASGGRIEAQLVPSELYSGPVDAGGPTLLGSKSGFSPTVLNTLGGGLSSIAVRVTMNDGGGGLGDPWRNADALLINGASLGAFSDVVTQQTSPDGQTGLSMNPAGGFRSDSLDTGFFSSTDSGLLSRIYAALARTGQVDLAWQSTAAAGRSLDFASGLSPEIQAASSRPVLAFNPPIITDVTVNSPIFEGSTATITVTAFNLHRPSSGDVLTYQFDPNNDGTFPISNTTGAATIGFDRPGVYIVPIRVYNTQGAQAVAQAVVEVRNVAPTATAPDDQQAVEGSTASLHLGSFSDPGLDAPWTVVVDWGDGSSPQTFDVSQAGDLGTIDHLYVRAGSYTVGVQVTDAGGLSDGSDFTVSVANVAPTVASPGDQTAVQGAVAAIELGSFTDPGQDDPWIVSVDWGDGSAAQSFRVDQAGGLGSLSHAFAQPAFYDVTVTVVDLDGLGLSGSSTFRVVVQGVAPSLSSPGDQKAVEGDPTPIAIGSILDAVENGPWTIQIDWGDGSDVSSFEATKPGALNPALHAYPRAGRFSVVVTATSANGLSDSVAFGVDVSNLAPDVTSPGDQTANEGTASAFTLGSFRDPGDDAPWTVVVNWGDGSDPETFQTTSQGNLGSLGHLYSTAGRYAVSVQVVDSGGMSGSGGFAVDVANVAPLLASPGDQSTLEGSPTSMPLGSFTDPGANAPWTVRVSWSDGAEGLTTTLDRPGDLGTITRAFGLHGVYQATVEVTDAQGQRGTSTFLVTVGDVAPVFDAVRFPAVLVESESGTLAATFHDPGFLDRFHIAVDWGDQTSSELGDGVTVRDLQASHAYATAGTYQVVVTVVDLAGAAATARLSVAVGTAPTVAPPSTPSPPAPQPAAHNQAPPLHSPLENGQITALDFFSTPSPKGQPTPASPPRGLLPSFPGVPGQGLGGFRPFAKLSSGSDAEAGGRSLEEILAVLLTPPKAVVQASSVGRADVSVAGDDPRSLVPTAGPKPVDIALAGLADPEAVSNPVSAPNHRPRGKAAKVMILIVAWTVSLRNQRGSRYARRSGRYGSEKARPSARPA